MTPDPEALLAVCPDSLSVTRDMDTLVLQFPDRLPSRHLGNVAMLLMLLCGLAAATVVSVLLVPPVLLAALLWRRWRAATTRGALRLSPHSLQVDERPPFLLEDIHQIEICPPAGSRWVRLHTRDGVFDLFGGLRDEEALWLGQLLSHRVQHRQAQLAEAGHDLSVRGAPPQELLQIRS